MKHFFIALLILPFALCALPFVFVGWVIYFVLTWVSNERLRKKGISIQSGNLFSGLLSNILKK